ncbi:hypothetical protein HHK36_020203 [Tetracentron sinense]|uniref:Uncharacterized protein n=1 Tax=Tetracentron sinense TaxID=13715 RepID=A0A834YWQ4_TETSI|nr:hypothetical protein HHK36_020203 [Tetracentron sinense]
MAYMVELVFCFKGNGGKRTDINTVSEVIKQALAKVLVYYYPLAGSLTLNSDRKLMVNCTGEGVPFAEAISDSEIEVLGDVTLLNDLSKLRNLVLTFDSAGNVTELPLLTVQCYDMEEILDEFTLRLEQQYQRQGIVGFLYKTVNFVTNLKLRHNIATKIQAIKKSIVEVSARRQRYGLNCLEQTSNSNSKIDTMHDLRQNALLLEEAELVGINESREKLIRCLVEGKSRLEVVSVWSMVSLATSQPIWLGRVLEDIGLKQGKATPLFCDNKSTILISKNPIYQSRTKHIAIKHHFIRESVEDDEIQLKYCKTDDQVADIFTKALPKDKFQYFREMLGVQQQGIKGNVKTLMPFVFLFSVLLRFLLVL